MKNKLLTSFLIFALGTLCSIFSWDSTAATFYPLAVGNVWSYHLVQFAQFSCVPYISSDYIVKVDSLVLKPNGKKYYKFSDGSMQRIDSASMNVYLYQGINECLADSLLARKNDSIRFCQNDKGVVYDTSGIFFAGTLRKALHIRKIIIGDFSHKLVEGLGLYYRIACEGGGNQITLNGCIINGMQYGTIIGLEKTSNEIPEFFNLEQNYPNPFNPSTMIRFEIPLMRGVSTEGGRGVFVKVTIYEIAGREVELIVNEQLKPGIYQIEWNASKYASGAYFYSLRADNFIITRKMILIK